MLSPIMQGFFEDRSKSGNNDVCINLYPDIVQGPRGPEIGLLFDCPGLLLLPTTDGTRGGGA